MLAVVPLVRGAVSGTITESNTQGTFLFVERSKVILQVLVAIFTPLRWVKGIKLGDDIAGRVVIGHIAGSSVQQCSDGVPTKGIKSSSAQAQDL